MAEFLSKCDPSRPPWPGQGLLTKAWVLEQGTMATLCEAFHAFKTPLFVLIKIEPDAVVRDEGV